MKIKRLKELIDTFDDDAEVLIRLGFLNVVHLSVNNLIVFDVTKTYEEENKFNPKNESFKYSMKSGKIVKQIRLPNGLKIDVEKQI